jgi:Secretion system C-terminal sorting domain
MKRKLTFFVLLTIFGMYKANAQGHTNDNIWYNNGAEVTCQPGCLVTVQGDMTNNGLPDPTVNHLTNNGFVWVQGNLFGDDRLEQRGTGTLRLMNSSTVGGAPYTGQYQVISGGYRVRGCQSAIGVTDGSIYNLELGNDQGLVFIKTEDADVRNTVNFNAPATIQENNSGIDASSVVNRILTYNPGTGATPAAAPANGANYTTVFGMMNSTPGIGNYLQNTIFNYGTTSVIDNAYIQGKHRRAIAAAGGAYGYPLGLEPSTAQGRGVQYSLYTFGANTYDCITGYFQEGSNNTGTATTVCATGTPDCWAGLVHGEWIYGSSVTGGGTGAYNLEIFPQHYNCSSGLGYTQTKDDLVATQLAGTENCEASPVTLDQNWPQSIPANTQYSFVSWNNITPVKLISFGAIPEASGIKLNWETTNEINMKNYVVERSNNGTTNWTTIATVAARNQATNSSYNAYDNAPATCKNYYRLKTVENNNTIAYSSVVLVKYNCGKESITIYPNPATTVVNVSITNSGSTAIAKILNASGKTVWTGNLRNGSNSIDVSNMASGVYVLQMTNKKGSISSEKIIVQH